MHSLYPCVALLPRCPGPVRFSGVQGEIAADAVPPQRHPLRLLRISLLPVYQRAHVGVESCGEGVWRGNSRKRHFLGFAPHRTVLALGWPLAGGSKCCCSHSPPPGFWKTKKIISRAFSAFFPFSSFRKNFCSFRKKRFFKLEISSRMVYG